MKRRVISALLHPGRGLMPAVESWIDERGNRCIGPAIKPPPMYVITERDLYERAMREGSR